MANVSKVNAKGRGLREVNTDIKAAVSAGGSVVVGSAEHIAGLAAGLKSGTIRIEGDAGDYVGALKDGASITVDGAVGRFVADNMLSGEVVVKGNAGFCAAPYCYGGTVLIRGDAGDFSATLNKGAAIVVTGNVGHDAATYMMAGDVILLGNAGDNLANYLIRGSVCIRGSWGSLGHNTKVIEVTEEDIARLGTLLKGLGLDVDPRTFKKIVPETDKPFYAKKDDDEEAT